VLWGSINDCKLRDAVGGRAPTRGGGHVLSSNEWNGADKARKNGQSSVGGMADILELQDFVRTRTLNVYAVGGKRRKRIANMSSISNTSFQILEGLEGRYD